MLPDQIKKAEIAMMKVGMRALQVGAFVSKPIFEGARYDYIIERDGKLYRAQVKYADGKLHRGVGAVYVNLRKQIKKDKNCPYSESEVDAPIVYVPKIDKVLVRTGSLLRQARVGNQNFTRQERTDQRLLGSRRLLVISYARF
jgi:hypothetical protein